MGRRFSPKERVNLPGSRYGVGISWDRVGIGNIIDVDLQCIVVDAKGSIIDAVYYNNMKAQKCITHSGDERTGDKKGMDEVVWAGVSKLPENVKMLVFVVAAHSGGHLRDVTGGMIHVLEESKDNEIGNIPMEKSHFDVDVIMAMIREGQKWVLQFIDEPAQEGEHFMDVLEPTMGHFIRSVIPSAPKKLKVAFAMEKGTVFDLPSPSQMHFITAGLGWDAVGKGVDLDVSAVLLDDNAKTIGSVYFKNLQGFGLTHSGDNRTGVGSGDDETIKCELEKLPSNAAHIFFTVHVYSKNVTFSRVTNPYCRVLDDTGAELARYMLTEGGTTSGLLLARLFREQGGSRWGFQAVGTYCGGRVWRDSVADMVDIIKNPPPELRPRPAPALPPVEAPQDPAPAPPGGPEVDTRAAPTGGPGMCGPGGSCAVQ